MAIAAAALVVAFFALYWGAVRLVGDVGQRGAANADAIAGFERAAGIDVRAIQESVVARGWSSTVLTWCYALGYWPIVGASVALTIAFDRAALWRVVSAYATSGGLGVIVFTLFPVSPPRLVGAAADQVGHSATLSALARPSGLLNPHAAMPSFHVAWTVLAALALSALARRWGGPLAQATLWAWPVVISIAVVTTGNHWALDVVAGLALALVAWWLAPYHLALIRRNLRTARLTNADDGDRRPDRFHAD